MSQYYIFGLLSIILSPSWLLNYPLGFLNLKFLVLFSPRAFLYLHRDRDPPRTRQNYLCICAPCLLLLLLLQKLVFLMGGTD